MAAHVLPEYHPVLETIIDDGGSSSASTPAVSAANLWTTSQRSYQGAGAAADHTPPAMSAAQAAATTSATTAAATTEAAKAAARGLLLNPYTQELTLPLVVCDSIFMFIDPETQCSFYVTADDGAASWEKPPGWNDARASAPLVTILAPPASDTPPPNGSEQDAAESTPRSWYVLRDPSSLFQYFVDGTCGYVRWSPPEPIASLVKASDGCSVQWHSEFEDADETVRRHLWKMYTHESIVIRGGRGYVARVASWKVHVLLEEPDVEPQHRVQPMELHAADFMRVPYIFFEHAILGHSRWQAPEDVLYSAADDWAPASPTLPIQPEELLASPNPATDEVARGEMQSYPAAAVDEAYAVPSLPPDAAPRRASLTFSAGGASLALSPTAATAGGGTAANSSAAALASPGAAWSLGALSDVRGGGSPPPAANASDVVSRAEGAEQTPHRSARPGISVEASSIYTRDPEQDAVFAPGTAASAHSPPTSNTPLSPHLHGRGADVDAASSARSTAEVARLAIGVVESQRAIVVPEDHPALPSSGVAPGPPPDEHAFVVPPRAESVDELLSVINRAAGNATHTPAQPLNEQAFQAQMNQPGGSVWHPPALSRGAAPLTAQNASHLAVTPMLTPGLEQSLGLGFPIGNAPLSGAAFSGALTAYPVPALHLGQATASTRSGSVSTHQAASPNSEHANLLAVIARAALSALASVPQPTQGAFVGPGYPNFGDFPAGVLNMMPAMQPPQISTVSTFPPATPAAGILNVMPTVYPPGYPPPSFTPPLIPGANYGMDNVATVPPTPSMNPLALMFAQSALQLQQQQQQQQQQLQQQQIAQQQLAQQRWLEAMGANLFSATGGVALTPQPLAVAAAAASQAGIPAASVRTAAGGSPSASPSRDGSSRANTNAAALLVPEGEGEAHPPQRRRRSSSGLGRQPARPPRPSSFRLNPVRGRRASVIRVQPSANALPDSVATGGQERNSEHPANPSQPAQTTLGNGGAVSHASHVAAAAPSSVQVTQSSPTMTVPIATIDTMQSAAQTSAMVEGGATAGAQPTLQSAQAREPGVACAMAEVVGQQVQRVSAAAGYEQVNDESAERRSVLAAGSAPKPDVAAALVGAAAVQPSAAPVQRFATSRAEEAQRAPSPLLSVGKRMRTDSGGSEITSSTPVTVFFGDQLVSVCPSPILSGSVSPYEPLSDMWKRDTLWMDDVPFHESSASDLVAAQSLAAAANVPLSTLLAELAGGRSSGSTAGTQHNPPKSLTAWAKAFTARMQTALRSADSMGARDGASSVGSQPVVGRLRPASSLSRIERSRQTEVVRMMRVIKRVDAWVLDEFERLQQRTSGDTAGLEHEAEEGTDDSRRADEPHTQSTVAFASHAQGSGAISSLRAQYDLACQDTSYEMMPGAREPWAHAVRSEAVVDARASDSALARPSTALHLPAVVQTPQASPLPHDVAPPAPAARSSWQPDVRHTVYESASLPDAVTSAQQSHSVYGRPYSGRPLITAPLAESEEAPRGGLGTQSSLPDILAAGRPLSGQQAATRGAGSEKVGPQPISSRALFGLPVRNIEADGNGGSMLPQLLPGKASTFQPSFTLLRTPTGVSATPTMSATAFARDARRWSAAGTMQPDSEAACCRADGLRSPLAWERPPGEGALTSTIGGGASLIAATMPPPMPATEAYYSASTLDIPSMYNSQVLMSGGSVFGGITAPRANMPLDTGLLPSVRSFAHAQLIQSAGPDGRLDIGSYDAGKAATSQITWPSSGADTPRMVLPQLSPAVHTMFEPFKPSASARQTDAFRSGPIGSHLVRSFMDSRASSLPSPRTSAYGSRTDVRASHQPSGAAPGGLEARESEAATLQAAADVDDLIELLNM